MAKVYKIAAAGFAVYLAISLLISRLVPMKKPSDAWVLFGGLAAIGVFAAAAYLWFESRKARAEQTETNPTPEAPSGDELSQILREAEEKLSSSKLGQGARFSQLPAVFLVGEHGATKTTVMVNSGLEPELLAGQVYQDNSIAPTRFANLWYARQTVFLEPGESVFSDRGKWSRLIRRMQPGKLAAVRTGEQAPRAVVVCFDCETFLKPGATDAIAGMARTLHGKLTEISKLLGISLPVYVLFTKADRISFFHDYVHTLTTDEATQVLGATLPLVSGPSKGIYAEEQTARLNNVFNRLYLSLCEKRIDFLARENDPERLPGTYEFPRELRKTRTAIVQFLVDLCRPSELSAAPFLRGFYFCGVRPVFVRESLAAPVQRQAAAQRSSESLSGATGIFRLGQGGGPAQPAPAGEVTEARKVPQWVFLNHFFTNVLLADHSALTASGTSTKTNSLRRILLSSAAALCLLLLLACTISFSHNKRLLDGARSAAAGISSTEAVGANLPSTDALRRLETLRQSVARLARYNRDGAPLSFRFGLYSGDAMYPEVRSLYFSKFNQLLLGPTQQRLLTNMRGLPGAPPPGSCEYPYDSLKMYLITTSNPDKSTKGYLSPKLLARWSEARDVDAQRLDLAKTQFDFYSEERKYDKASDNDTAIVKGTRDYLGKCADDERIYRAILADVNAKDPSVNFNRDFKGSEAVVVNNRDVAGAFTKKGWADMQDKIKKADFSGDDWVLGDQAKGKGDVAKLQQYLRNRYLKDYIDQWRDYLNKTRVVGYSGIPDAARKLKVNTGPSSPLLAMFCLAAQNTEVDSPDVAKAFKPLHAVVPAGCDTQPVGPMNNDYMQGLLALQGSLDDLGPGDPDPADPKLANAASNETNAKQRTGNMALSLGRDPDAHLENPILNTLLAPITSVEPFIKGRGAAALNRKAGAELCTPLRTLMGKYPFNPRGPDATLDEVNNILKPVDGLLWKFQEANLKNLLQKQGTAFTAIPGGGVNLTPAFVMFFNRAATFSQMLYANGPNPVIKYSLKPVSSEASQDAAITIDGQTITFRGSPVPKQFVWPGSQQGAMGTAKLGGTDIWGENDPGLWGVFKFFAKGQRRPGTGLHEWTLVAGISGSGQVKKIGTIQVEVEPSTFPPGFPNLGCPSQVAQ